VRLFGNPRRSEDERLLWTRDIRFANRLVAEIPTVWPVELDAGVCIIGPVSDLSDAAVAAVARMTRDPEFGIVAIDGSLPEAERYLRAFSSAVQLSGLADRIGMARTTEVAQTKVLDHFFVLRSRHGVRFQPIVRLVDNTIREYECLFRPDMPMLPTSISAIVQAAIDTERSLELDAYIAGHILARASELEDERHERGEPPLHLAINVTPGSLLAPEFEAGRFADRVHLAGLRPEHLTVECTEQQAVPDVVPLQRQVKALRRAGFGFAVDDAGAGYASFSMIAALRPSVIKIDRQIVNGVAADDAKQALVGSFVSFAERIDAELVAEGIERRRDLNTLIDLGVPLGQGYLLGKPAPEPQPARDLTSTRRAPTRVADAGRRLRRARPASASLATTD